MKPLTEVVNGLYRRKIMFDEGQFLTVLWCEAINVLEKSGYKEPLKREDIVREMITRGREVVTVADALYQQYDRPVTMTFANNEYALREDDGKERYKP